MHPKDMSIANRIASERSRLIRKLLNFSETLTDEDRIAIANLIPEDAPPSPKRSVNNEAEHIAVFYFDILRKRFLARSSKKRLSASQRSAIAEDAIYLAVIKYPSMRGQLTVKRLIGSGSKKGLINAIRNKNMRRHFRDIRWVFEDPLHYLPPERRRFYLNPKIEHDCSED